MYVGRARPSGGDRLAPPLPGGGPAFSQSEDRTEPAALELTLHPDVVTNIDDAAGRWQHERGRVSDHGTQIGVYASTSHLAAAGTGHHDTTFTLTIFFLGGLPPESLTVHGTHEAGSDSEAGTVSAASAGHASRVGDRFRRAGDIMTID